MTIKASALSGGLSHDIDLPGRARPWLHHIEHVARSIDHRPRNLCVLCANHHRFIHYSGEWAVRHDGANVIFTRGARELLVERPTAVFATA